MFCLVLELRGKRFCCRLYNTDSSYYFLCVCCKQTIAAQVINHGLETSGVWAEAVGPAGHPGGSSVERPARLFIRWVRGGLHDQLCGQASLLCIIHRHNNCASSTAVLPGLKYAKSHEWAKVDGDIATVGISDHAQVRLGGFWCTGCTLYVHYFYSSACMQAELGDVVYVELPEVGKSMKQGDTFGVVESVKVCWRTTKHRGYGNEGPPCVPHVSVCPCRLPVMCTALLVARLWR